MKKVKFLLLFLLFSSGFLFGQYKGFLAVGPEVNAHSREGVAIGGSILTGIDYDKGYSFGLKASFFTNLDTVKLIEPIFIFRKQLPLALYLQAEAGCVVYYECCEPYPAFSGGLGLGMRIKLGDRLYIEPGLRFGYPYIWGAGVSCGLRLEVKNGK